jgi:hypothetical protein
MSQAPRSSGERLWERRHSAFSSLGSIAGTNFLGDLVLQGEDVGQIAIVAIGPEVITGRAAHRGTAAAATTSASVRRSMPCVQEQPTGGVRPNARENGQIRSSNATRTAWKGDSRPYLASGLPASSENAYHSRQFGVHPGNPGLILAPTPAWPAEHVGYAQPARR